MDQTSSSQQSTETQGTVLKPNNRKKIGFLEIILASLVITLLLGILNYFKIFPISNLSPKYLSWLPQMSSQETLPTAPIQTIPTQTTIPINKVAEEVFSKFISDNLIPSMSSSLPATTPKEDDKEQNTFSLNWESKIGTMSATFALLPETKDISYLYLSSTYNAEDYTSLSPQTAKDIASVFFTTIQKEEWACKPLYESTYCESFWQENVTTKRGISINGPLLLPNSRSVFIVSLCEYHKEDSSLYARKSCTTEFADSGIK